MARLWLMNWCRGMLRSMGFGRNWRKEDFFSLGLSQTFR